MLIDSLLDKSIGAILIKGEPGTGKTSMALELLRRSGEGLYISTRASREKLFRHIPGITEMLVETEGIERSSSGSVEIQDLRLASPTQIIESVLKATKQMRDPFIVLDSWDAIAKELASVERLKTEKALVAMTEANSKLIFISEEPSLTTVDYLVDAIIELRREFHDGAVVRTMEVRKLRGGKILHPKYLFTLADSKFELFEYLQEQKNPLKARKFKAIGHTQNTFSSGVKDLDSAFGSGFRRGSIALLEFGNGTDAMKHAGTFNPIRCNFVLNGGCAVSVPAGAADPLLLIDNAKAVLPSLAVAKRLAVSSFEKYDNPSMFLLSRTSARLCFSQLRKKIAQMKGKRNNPCFITIGLDVLQSIFDDRDVLYHLSRLIQIARRNKDFLAIICGSSSNLKPRLADICDVHVKYEMINETQVFHSIKPSSSLLALNYDYSRGYAYPVMVPIL